MTPSLWFAPHSCFPCKHTYTHTIYSHTRICRLCCHWNDDVTQHRVTCGWVTAKLCLFLHSNKHSLAMFTLWAPTPTAWPQKTCTPTRLYPGSLPQNGRTLKNSKQTQENRAEKKTSAPGIRAIFQILFWPIMSMMGCLQPLQCSLSATLTQLPPKYRHSPCVYVYLALRAAFMSVRSLEDCMRWCLYSPSGCSRSVSSWTTVNMRPCGVRTDW